MVESKGWNWEIVQNDKAKVWLEPSIESYYLLSKWKSESKKTFLDLGCGLGRHSVLFGKNGFDVLCFDISQDAINRTKEWAENLGLKLDYAVGDMINLPYSDESIDCILCRNVISHTDTEGMKQIITEIKRVLRKNGECYLTLGSKDTWGFKQETWPLIDPNTRIRMEEGPEYKVPHFYADYDLIKELFSDFEILNVYQVVDYYDKKDSASYHYHILIRKKHKF